MNCFFIKYGNKEIQAGQPIHRWISLDSFTVHRKTLGGQLHAYCCFVPCGNEQILQNCIYIPPNIRSIHIINNKLDPMTVFPFGLTTKRKTQGRSDTRISLLSVGPGANCPSL